MNILRIPASGSCPGVKSRMNFPEVAPVQVSVDLSRLDRAVAEDLLHDAQVASSLEEMRRARVPQRMRRDRLIDSRRPGVPAQELPVSHPRERPSESSEEHRPLAPVLEEERTRPLQIAEERSMRLGAIGDDSLARPLPGASNQPLVQVDLFEPKPHELRGSEPGRVGHLEQR